MNDFIYLLDLYEDSKYCRNRSAFETEMNKQGYKLITNFKIEDEKFYRRAAKLHGLDIRIENDTYYSNGNLLDDGIMYKAFYISKSNCNLTNFWKTFDEMKYQ